MSYDPQNPPEEKKSLFGVIMHSFFVVPFLIAVVSVLLFAAVRILTTENRSVYDYLDDIKKGGVDKRWQGAFELSRILTQSKDVPSEPLFINRMIEAHQQSRTDDPRVYQYLTMAMARAGHQEYVDVLIKDLEFLSASAPTEKENNPLAKLFEEKDENLYAIISGLGILKNNKAAPVLLKFLDSDNPRLRLATVIALGNISDNASLEPLKRRLDDSEVNVAWDAAIALAKMGDKTGRGLILKMLDRQYLKSFTNVSPQNQSKIMQVAIQVSSAWRDKEFKEVYQKLFETDPNMNVRALAKEALTK